MSALHEMSIVDHQSVSLLEQERLEKERLEKERLQNLNNAQVQADLVDLVDKLVKDPEVLKFLLLPDVYSNDQQILKFVDYVWDKIPTSAKEIYPSKNELFRYCIDHNSEHNMYRVVLINLQKTLEDMKNEDREVLIHILFVWGIAGSGKSSIIKIMATLFNSINPDDEGIANIKIDSNEVGTTEVSDMIKFNIGAYKMGILDVPGTEDISEDRSYSKIIEGIKSKGTDAGAVLYTIDLIDATRNKGGSQRTLTELASASKSIGLKFWERVIIVITKTNDFGSQDNQKPECSNDFSEQEFSDYIDEYREYIKNYNIKLQERINGVKECFKTNWYKLFDDNILDNVSEKEKEEVFNKISFVPCGDVKLRSEFKDAPNPFKRCTVRRIPEFGEILELPGISERNKEKMTELNNKIKDGHFILYKNWASSLAHKIVRRSSSVAFRINFASLNSEANARREHADNVFQEEEQQNRRPDINEVENEEETFQNISSAVGDYVERKREEKKYQDRVLAGFGAAAGGTATIAAAAAFWVVAAGIGGGLGAGYAISKTVSYFTGGPLF